MSKPAEFHCPECHGTQFLEGPHGGLSVNFCCVGCGARFNDGWPFGIQQTPADGDERVTFWQTYRAYYTPRCSNLTVVLRHFPPSE